MSSGVATIECAEILLRGLGLAEITARVGYESEASFNRAFTRLVGALPGTWRQAKSASPGSGPVLTANSSGG
jgi:AraC-like DNA-binding protein